MLGIGNAPWLSKQLAVACVCAILFLFLLYGHAQKRLFQQQKRQLEEHLKASNASQRKLLSVLVQDEKEPSPNELLAVLKEDMPNVPIIFYNRNYERLAWTNATCPVRYPNFKDLEYHNDHWQTFRQGHQVYRLYAAYYDRRLADPDYTAQGMVHLLTMIDQTSGPFPQRFCQFWYENEGEPVVVPVTETTLLWDADWLASYPTMSDNTLLFPYMLSCAVPDRAPTPQAPSAVSLIGRECANATNSLKVHNKEWATRPPFAPSQSFAVCVKGLDYADEDLSYRLVEWLEMQRLLGAAKVIIYDYWHHPNVSKVLDHYVRTSKVAPEFKVEVRSFSLATAQPHLPQFEHMMLQTHLEVSVLHEMIAYQDCFYRHMYDYQYVGLIDIDELLMPLGDVMTWPALVRHLPTPAECVFGAAAICFRNVFFPPTEGEHAVGASAPPYLYMLEHTQRLRNHSEWLDRTKCLHNTQLVAYVHNHFPLRLLADAGVCGTVVLSPQEAQLQHYRELPPLSDEEPQRVHAEDLVEDASLQRYAGQLTARTRRTLEHLLLI